MQIRVTFASQSLDFHMRVVRDNVHELSIATATNGKADASTCDCNRVAVSVQIEGSQQTTRTQQHASITNLPKPEHVNPHFVAAVDCELPQAGVHADSICTAKPLKPDKLRCIRAAAFALHVRCTFKLC